MDSPLRDAAGALYALAPEAFVAARDRHARAARDAGDRDLARRLASLRRPSAAAWAVNCLVREYPQDVDRLLGLGAALQAAQEDPSGTDLRALSRRRQEVLADLVGRAGALAADAGRVLGEPVRRQVQATLGAAMADPSAGAAVRSGLLVADLTSTGFGPVEVDDAVALPPDAAAIAEVRAIEWGEEATGGSLPERAAAGRVPRRADADGRGRADVDGRGRADADGRGRADVDGPRRADADRVGRRAAAERQLREAEAAVVAADRALAQARAALDDVVGRRAGLDRRVAELTETIADLTNRLHEARHEDATAAHDERRARRALDTAAHAARRAELDEAAARGRLEDVR